MRLPLTASALAWANGGREDFSPEVECAKGIELVNWQDGTGSTLIVQPGCTKPVNCQRKTSKEVEKELTGKETEPWEIVYFKLY